VPASQVPTSVPAPPSAAPVAPPPTVLDTVLTPPNSIAVIALAGTTRSTLPPDFGAVQPVSGFVPSSGFSPEDVLVLALAVVLGLGLVAWEIVEESQWST
jgi:hypothetical protein